MALLSRHSWALLALAAVVPASCATPVAGAAGPAISACESYGDRLPAELAKKQARKSMQCLLNAERAAFGLQPLRRVKKLETAAQRHSHFMLEHGCFSHQCKGERGLAARLRRFNYLGGGLTRWLYGENLVWGLDSYGTPRTSVAELMDSAPHRENILNPGFDEVGVGFVVGSFRRKGEGGGLYTIDFGFRRG